MGGRETDPQALCLHWYLIPIFGNLSGRQCRARGAIQKRQKLTGPLLPWVSGEITMGPLSIPLLC